MKFDNQFMIVKCRKIRPVVNIPVDECARCEFHGGVERIQPCKDSGEPVKIKAEECVPKTIEIVECKKTNPSKAVPSDKCGDCDNKEKCKPHVIDRIVFSYDVICNIPVRIRTEICASGGSEDGN